jgi:hypothetical protein
MPLNKMTVISEVKLKDLASKCNALQKELEWKSKKFDYHIEHDEDCETARMLYIEIKELRSRIHELSSQTN